MATSIVGGVGVVDPNKRNIKRVRVSKQRQVNIPKEFYDSLNLEEEAYVEFTGNSLILRPVKNEEVDFSEYILRDLVDEGYTGEDLIRRFSEIKSQLPGALDSLIEDSKNRHVVEGDLDEYLDSLDEEELDE